jgi:protein-disulfide isomerase
VVVLMVATVVMAIAFPSGNAAAAAAVPVESLPVIPDAERAKFAEWWELQPKEDVPVDGGGAKVVVVKFNDYQCPLCGVTYKMHKPLFDKYGGSVKLVTKHYALESECNPGGGGTHVAACEAAAAVIMARPKGTAEKMEDWLFSHQGPPILTPDQVKEAARDVGGITDFDAQYSAALKEIRADAALGQQLKVNSTPTIFINGRRVPNQAFAPQYINLLIEIELKR